MLAGNGRTLQFKVKEILLKLKENRENHVDAYKATLLSFHMKRRELASNLGVRTGESYNDADFTKRLSELAIMARPISHEEDYTEAIEMLSWTSQEEIELTTEVFNQYIRDQWSWKKQFDMLSTTYGSGK
jgi:hypothetical protein